jgi:xanthosine utilization system XapX-like protein
MLILAMICFPIGVVLGLRFRMLILVPAMGLALAMVVFNGVLVGESIWQLAGTMVVVATVVQLGYFGGSILPLVTHALVTHAKDAAARRGEFMPSSTEVSSSGRMRKRGGAPSRFDASKPRQA